MMCDSQEVVLEGIDNGLECVSDNLTSAAGLDCRQSEEEVETPRQSFPSASDPASCKGRDDAYTAFTLGSDEGLTVSCGSTAPDSEACAGGDRDSCHAHALIDVERAALLLSGGLVEILEREITLSKKKIAEVIKHQEIVLESVQHENTKFSDEAVLNLGKQMAKVQQYIGKLGRIRKDMTHITEQTARLKHTAARLVMQRQKDLVETVELRHRNLEREKHLVAQPAAPLSAMPVQQLADSDTSLGLLPLQNE